MCSALSCFGTQIIYNEDEGAPKSKKWNKKGPRPTDFPSWTIVNEVFKQSPQGRIRCEVSAGRWGCYKAHRPSSAVGKW